MYIAFEGIDGCGKSTQRVRLLERLVAAEKEVVVFREPGGTSLGEKLREMLLHGDFEISPRAQLNLFAAARLQLLPVITEAEEQGKLVVTDRCLATSYAYQGHALGLGFDLVAGIHSGVRWPDVVLWLDLPPEEAVQRYKPGFDRFHRDLDFAVATRDGYQKLSSMLFPCNFLRVDAEGSVETVHDRIWDVLQPFIFSSPSV